MTDDKESNLSVPNPEGQSEFLFYQTENGLTRIQVRLQGGTVWLSQRLIADLFGKTVATINHHIKELYAEGELAPEATIREYLIVQTEGTRRVERRVEFYNLDVIIAIGYRVRSQRGTQFRQWATGRLREFIVKGFVLDDQRLAEGQGLGGDYFDELLERIRAIRASERRFYQKITDIYATSIDYDSTAAITQQFYAIVQNKLHWAIHGHTAAEIIALRADASRPHMGLATWKNAPRGPVRKADVTIAKNYLTQEELSALNQIVTMYLDYADLQARARRPMHMADWVRKLDAFLQFNEQNVLTHAGKITHELAEEHALREFEEYDAQCRQLESTQPTSDFDKAVEEVKRLVRQAGALSSPRPGKKRKRKRDTD